MNELPSAIQFGGLKRSKSSKRGLRGDFTSPNLDSSSCLQSETSTQINTRLNTPLSSFLSPKSESGVSINMNIGGLQSRTSFNNTTIRPPTIDMLEIDHPSLLEDTGSHIPYALRKMMRYFPRIQRIPPLMWLNQSIFSIYMDKIYSDICREKKGLSRLSLPETIFQHYLEMYGSETVTDVQVCDVCVVRRCLYTRIGVCIGGIVFVIKILIELSILYHH